MNNKLSISLIILFSVVGLYFLNLNQQKEYNSSSTNFINIDQNSINKFIIQSQNEALEIIRQDTSWAISGHDSLIIKAQTLTNFFDKVINLKSQALMTSKQEKWHKFNIELLKLFFLSTKFDFLVRISFLFKRFSFILIF